MPKKPLSSRLYSYIVTHDTGFAPCVNDEFCILGCCKVDTRRVARKHDWIAGTTGANYGSGKLIFLMRVEDDASFAQYYDDPRFEGNVDRIHKPDGHGGYTRVPNLYHGPKDAAQDLKTDKVLIATDRFVYFGKHAPTIPSRFKQFVCTHRIHKRFDSGFDRLIRWAFKKGYRLQGEPHQRVLPRTQVVSITPK